MYITKPSRPGVSEWRLSVYQSIFRDRSKLPIENDDRWFMGSFEYHGRYFTLIDNDNKDVPTASNCIPALDLASKQIVHFQDDSVIKPVNAELIVIEQTKSEAFINRG